MKLPKLVRLTGVESDGKDTVAFHFESADGRTHNVPIKVAAINAMVPTLINVTKSIGDAPSIEVQPASLTSARGAYREDGTPMLEIGLDEVMLRVSLAHPGAIPKLQKILADFQSRSGGSNARH
jgi:hypothetical protein